MQDGARPPRRARVVRPIPGATARPYLVTMPSLTLRAFRKALTDRAFSPVYLLYGEEDHTKEAGIRELVAAVVDPALRDFNLEIRRGAELDGETLGTLLGTPPLMAERRLVVVRDASALKKDARKALDAYLPHPSPDTVLALVLPAGAKADKALLALDLPAVEYKPLSGDAVEKWIAHQAEAELGGSITPEGASLLHAAVGADLPLLAAELDKLLSYTNGAEIDEAAVSAIVGVRRGETVGDFLDAVGERDAGRALQLLPQVLQQPKVSGVTLVMALAMQFGALAWAQAARAEGLPAQRLESELFGYLKECGGYAGRAWGEAVKAWVRQLRHWSATGLEAALATLLTTDQLLKETTFSNEEQLLSTMVLTLCATA